MTLKRTHDQVIFEQAAHWHLLMQKSPSAEERVAFDDWLMESRRHVRNFLLVSAMDRELTQFDPQRRFNIDTLSAGDVASDVVPLIPNGTITHHHRAGRSARARRYTPWQWFAGAAAAVLIIACALVRPWDGVGRYSTATGEQRIVKLADGSVMYLNTQSRARVDYSERSRKIELLSGEALFVVARDPRRPFRVAAGSTMVQAVGTQFNVYRRETDTAVAVLEGRVQVFDTASSAATRASLPLGMGEAARVGNDGRISKQPTVNPINTVTWRERRLVFREDLLTDIVLEFNRYNPAPRFRVEGHAAGERRYSGIFDAYDPESLAQVLSADGNLVLDRAGKDILIRTRAPAFSANR